TIAAYGRPGDYVRFYEINPEVLRLAHETEYFSYLRTSAARVEVILGDARLSMERELEQGGSQQFDVLVLDAFSGGAIPLHLLTEEAFRIYFGHLRNPGGILALHISNAHIDLRPVVFALADHFGLAPPRRGRRPPAPSVGSPTCREDRPRCGSAGSGRRRCQSPSVPDSPGSSRPDGPRNRSRG